MKFHAYADVFPLIQGEDFDQLDFDHVYASGGVSCHIKSPFALVTVWPSMKHPGYWHARRIDQGAEAWETTRPMLPAGVSCLLQMWKVPSEKSAWTESASANDDELSPDEIAQQKASESVVYFFRAGPFVKIGVTGRDLEDRIAAIQCGCPYPIEALGTIPGSYAEENAMHKRFARYRTQGEWFRIDGALAKYINTNFAKVISP